MLPRVLVTKILQLLLGMHSSNKHYIILNWGIFNTSGLLNEHGNPPFYSKLTFSHDKIFCRQSLNENLLSVLFQRNYLNRKEPIQIVNQSSLHLILPGAVDPIAKCIPNKIYCFPFWLVTLIWDLRRKETSRCHI